MRALPRTLACTPLERTTGHKKPLTSTLQKNTHQEVRVFLVRKAAISQKRRSSHNERKNFSAFQTNTHSRKQQHGSALSTQSYFKRRRGKAPKRRFVNLTVEPEALLHPRKPGGRRQAGHAGSEDGHRGKRRAAAQHLSHGFSKPLPQVAGFLFCYVTLMAASLRGPLRARYLSHGARRQAPRQQGGRRRGLPGFPGAAGGLAAAAPLLIAAVPLLIAAAPLLIAALGASPRAQSQRPPHGPGRAARPGSTGRPARPGSTGRPGPWCEAAALRHAGCPGSSGRWRHPRPAGSRRVECDRKGRGGGEETGVRFRGSRWAIWERRFAKGGGGARGRVRGAPPAAPVQVGWAGAALRWRGGGRGPKPSGPGGAGAARGGVEAGGSGACGGSWLASPLAQGPAEPVLAVAAGSAASLGLLVPAVYVLRWALSPATNLTVILRPVTRRSLSWD